MCRFLTAVLWWVAGQSLGLFALGWVALVPFFYSLQGLTTRERFRQGWTTGWLCYSLINWWIIPTVAKASPMIGAPELLGAILGILAVALIGLIHGLLVALIAVIWNPQGRFWQGALWILPVISALVWALLDAARLETPLAHGWGALAYTQWRDVALLQHTHWLGQHGLTAICVWFAASFALGMQRVSPLQCWLAPVGVFIVLHGLGAMSLQTTSRTADEPQTQLASSTKVKSLRVLLVQTDVPSLSKNFAVGGESTFEQAMRLTREQVESARAANRGYDLVVWPETTLEAGRLDDTPGGNKPFFSLDMERVARLCNEFQVNVLFGATANNEHGQMLNAAVLMDGAGDISWTAKTRLVPFGEKAPLTEWLPFLRRFAPETELMAPTEVNTLRLRVRGEEIPLGVVICFESCFRYPARALVNKGARALFVLTNDEWFKGSNAPFEHMAMLAIRAAENGVPTAQAPNGGTVAAIDHHGRFMIKGTYGSAQTLSAELPIG
jgi:apolipoprotein N-acyltransferase